MKDLFIDFKKEWKKILLGIISMFLIAKWEMVVDIFDAGQKAKHQSEFNSSLMTAFNTDSVMIAAFNNDRFVELLFQSPLVKSRIDGFGEEMTEEAFKRIQMSDTNKISTRAYIAHASNIHPDSALPFLAKMVRFFKENDITTKKDFDKLKDILEAQDIKTTSRGLRRVSPHSSH